MAGRDDEALEVLEALNEKPRTDIVIQKEFADIKETVLEMSKGSFRSLLDMSEYREFHRVVLAYVNQMFQQISGINLITYYAPALYGKLGLQGTNINKLLAACNGTEYLLASFIPIFIIEKTGRRPLMLFGVSAITIYFYFLFSPAKVEFQGIWNVSLHGRSGWLQLAARVPGRQTSRYRAGGFSFCLQLIFCHWVARHDMAVPCGDCAFENPCADKCIVDEVCCVQQECSMRMDRN